MPASLSISVVICAYNEEEWIAATLNSLSHQRRLPDEIIVVDNVSTDKTQGIVETFIAAHPDLNIELIYEVKQGLHHAREAGWRAASSDIVAMTDADICFPGDWLEIIETNFQNDPEVQAITGIVRYPEAPAFINWVTWICDQLYQPEGIGKFITQEYVLNGGNSAYRRSALEAVNAYLNKPTDLLEDRYMSRQMHEANFKIKFVRNLKVWHSFRRFEKDGWRGYMNYIFFYDVETVYPDHINQE
jgi:glycosyltransferase involved in cell wall biosynthesis